MSHDKSTADPGRCAAAVEAARLIENDAELSESAVIFCESAAIGIDTEFVRERTFLPEPGLVQLSDGERVELLDLVTLKDFAPLAACLADVRRVKVLHSVGEDLEILDLVAGQVPEPLFDTQIAAALTGRPLQSRYEHLVADLFGVELPGGQARSNWRARPIPEKLCRYAAQDVIWLTRSHETLGEQLDQLDRLAWLEEDCSRLVAEASQPAPPRPVHRIKGAGRLCDKALERLQRLNLWREAEARRRNRPRGFILADDHMVALAAPTDRAGRRAALEKLPPRLSQRLGTRLQDILAEPPDPDFQPPPELKPLTSDQRVQVKQWQSAIRQVAEQLGIDPALIASKRSLTELARGNRPDWLNGWRGQFIKPLL